MDYSRININIPVYPAIAKYDLVSENEHGNSLPGSDGRITNKDIKEIIKSREVTVLELFMEFEDRLVVLKDNPDEYRLLREQYKQLYLEYFNSNSSEVAQEYVDYLESINKVSAEDELHNLLFGIKEYKDLTEADLERVRELMEEISGEHVPENLQYIPVPDPEVEDLKIIPGEIIDDVGIPLA